MNKLTVEEVSQLIIEYYQTDQSKHVRLGQFFCNKLSITDSELFYCNDKDACIQIMISKYSDNK